MGIIIRALETTARIKREAAASGGTRSMVLSVLNMGSEGEELDDDGNIVTRFFRGLWDGFKGLMGIVWQGLKFLGFGIASLVRGVFAAVRFFWNYNWRESLDTINQATQERFAELLQEWSGFAGRLVGSLICGALPGVVLFKFNPALGLFVLKEFGEEKLDEFLDDVDDVVTLTVRAFLAQGTRYLLYGIRYLATPVVKALFGRAETAGLLPEGTSANVDKFLEDDEPWTFSRAFDNLLQQAPGGEVTYDSLREFFDEAFEACYESGVMIAEFADMGMAQSAMQRSYLQAAPATVTVDFDDRGDDISP